MKEAAKMIGVSYHTLLKYKKQLDVKSPEQRAREKFSKKFKINYERI